jgi:hypothetical protein
MSRNLQIRTETRPFRNDAAGRLAQNFTIEVQTGGRMTQTRTAAEALLPSPGQDFPAVRLVVLHSSRDEWVLQA